MGLTTYPPSGGAAVWGDITGSVSAQTDLTTAFGTQGIKRYVALLTQSGTDAPVATVLENSLGGTLAWTYTGAGLYTGTLAGAFPDAAKIFIPMNNFSTPNNGGAFIRIARATANTVVLEATADDTISALDYPYMCEILVYP